MEDKTLPAFDLKSAQGASGYWYLATPYSKFEGGIEQAFRLAAIAAAHLIRLKVAVFSPIAHTHPVGVFGRIDPYDVDFWLKADGPLMRAACGLIVFTMPGWRESKGVTHEIEAFDREGKPIEYLRPHELVRLVADAGHPLEGEVQFQ